MPSLPDGFCVLLYAVRVGFLPCQLAVPIITHMASGWSGDPPLPWQICILHLYLLVHISVGDMSRTPAVACWRALNSPMFVRYTLDKACCPPLLHSKNAVKRWILTLIFQPHQFRATPASLGHCVTALSLFCSSLVQLLSLHVGGYHTGHRKYVHNRNFPSPCGFAAFQPLPGCFWRICSSLRAGLDRYGKSRPHWDSIPGPSSP